MIYTPFQAPFIAENAEGVKYIIPKQRIRPGADEIASAGFSRTSCNFLMV